MVKLYKNYDEANLEKALSDICIGAANDTDGEKEVIFQKICRGKHLVRIFKD